MIPGRKPILESDIAALDELAKLNPGHTIGQLQDLDALRRLLDEDDAATGHREPGEDES